MSFKCALFGHKSKSLSQKGAQMQLLDMEHNPMLVFEFCERCHAVYWRNPELQDHIDVIGAIGKAKAGSCDHNENRSRK
jgi:hypothetical protein